MLLLPLFACQPDPPAPTPAADAPPELREVWGVPAAEDVDPDPTVVEVHLEADEAEVDWVEGDPTTVWAYNGQVPGPLIHARVGDTLRVVFTNALDDETTIHWHGLRISDAMDGVPAIMDPVGPGESFTYEFTLPDAGTYWYHPHMMANEQIERGLQGAIVVDEAEPPEVDADRFFVLDDVLLGDDARIDGGFQNLPGMDGMMGRYGDTLLANGSTAVLADSVRPGSVERWRVLATSNARTLYVDVEGAAWRIVGTDGGLLAEPYERSPVPLPPGQRYDLEVIPEEGAETVTLEVLVPASTGRFDRFPVFEAAVEGEPREARAVSWTPVEAPEVRQAEQRVEIDLDADTSSGAYEWTINGIVYGEDAVMPVDGKVPTQIHITESSGLDHPFHLHGQFFQIVERVGGTTSEPGLKDVVLVPGSGEVTLYTEFENPGRWMAHCHILEHAELGMMTEMVVGE
ncbi:MAG: multicopper oxidase family protein [Myxococcota bacterium]